MVKKYDSSPNLSEEERKERLELYRQYSDAAQKNIDSSSDDFDKNLLTYSSGALGLSLAFIKDIVKLDHAVALPCLYWSWALLAACVVITILSYRFSIEGQKRRVDDAWEYFMKDDETYLNRKTFWSRLIDWCAYVGATFLLAGVVVTVVFVFLNVRQEHKMTMLKVTEARAPLNMTPTMNTLERGRAPLPMTPAQTSVPVARPSTPQSAPVSVTPLKKG